MTVTEIADQYLARLADIDPAAAALAGVPADPLGDLSPDGLMARYDLDRTTVAGLRGADPGDIVEERLRTVMIERLHADIALFDVGFTPGLLAPLATPLHGVRMAIESAPTASPEGWERLASILEAVPGALGGHRRTLDWALTRGALITRRQAEIVASQAESWVAAGPAGVVAKAATGAPDALRPRLDRAVTAACQAFVESADHLRRSVAPNASESDAVGDDIYSITSGAFLGETLDIDEVATWGRDQVDLLVGDARRLAKEIIPDGTIDEACALLDKRDVLDGADVPTWLSGRVSAAIRGMTERGWQLPEDAAHLECRVTEAAAGVMYYSPRSVDGLTPATVWWTIADDHVAPWRQVTTLHHEAVPGHHLQYAVMAEADLHPWQRHFCHVHGYAEGWAHHAEEVAVEMGLVDGAGERLGVVLGQLHRACRIVADTALHLDPRPDRDAGWHVARAVDYLRTVARLDPVTAEFEVDRYLGWPGQALAFRVGARQWARLRSRAESRGGPRFDVGDFYLSALALGPMGLEPLSRLTVGG